MSESADRPDASQSELQGDAGGDQTAPPAPDERALFGSRAPRSVEIGVGEEEAGATVGEELRRLLDGRVRPAADHVVLAGRSQTIHFDGTRLTIGRDPSNDIVLEDPNVSRFHAEVRAAAGALELRDLGSRNGTRLNGELTDRARIDAGASIGVGSLQLVFDGAGFLARDDYGLARLDATAVAVRVAKKQILAEATLSLAHGELVAIIGESGAGKTTLLRVLAGVKSPSSGAVTLNGEPLASRMTEIGYVPQDEVDHDGLSIHEALTYAARLRLPDDASSEQIEARVRVVLQELALSEHAHTRIGSLSGGQRRRASVAAELLGRPSLLLLDEPTTGLDPWLESKMMRLFRQLADHSRGIALVTHATKSLTLCDRVLAIAPGGELVFDGPPAAACEFFGADDYDAIYTALEETSPTQWRARFEAAHPGRVAAIEREREGLRAPHSRRRPRRSFWRQTRVLTSRYAKLMRRDRRNLLLLLLQPPLLGLAGAGLFAAGVFERPGGSPGDAIQVLFLAAMAITWLGSIDSVREIIKERGVFDRESALGVRVSAYLCSKLILLYGLMVIQTLLYACVLLAFIPLHASVHGYLEVLALITTTGFVAIAVGLFISSAVTTEAQATTALPLAFIPQLLFAGTIVPVASMAAPAYALACVTFSRWSLAAMGTAVDMNARMAETPGFAHVTKIGTHFFTTRFLPGLLIQGAFMAAFLAGTFALLRRKATGRS